MNLSELKPAKGSVSKKKRIGRGQGSGYGATAGRGNKGAQARSGYSRKIGFEGGQMPLQRRAPKFGFKNINRVEYKVVNLSSLQDLFDKTGISVIDREVLLQAGLISSRDLVKILGNGALTAKLEVSANAFSKSAIAAIEANQGTATQIA